MRDSGQAQDAMKDDIIGDPRLHAHVSRTELKGLIVAARIEYLRHEFGETAVRELAAVLPDAPHNFLTKPPLAVAWYPIETVIEFDRAMLQGPMRGRVEAMHGLGLFIAQQHLSTVYKVVMKLGSPGFVLARSDMLFSRYFRPGHLEAERAGDKDMRLYLAGGVLPRYICDAGVRGFIDAALLLSGATKIQSSHTRCVHLGDDLCEWRATWAEGGV